MQMLINFMLDHSPASLTATPTPLPPAVFPAPVAAVDPKGGNIARMRIRALPQVVLGGQISRILVLIVAGVLFLGCFEAEAEIRMASLFTDSMVLQQGMPVPIWGTAAPGEQVTVEFGNQKESTTADTTGQWRVTLKKLVADRNQVPQVLKVTGTNPKGGVSTVTINDVLIGEVWICSGQSNMQFPLRDVTNAKVESDEANYPQIRMFMLGRKTAAVPEFSYGGQWLVCDPAKREEPSGRITGNFSAVGYFFCTQSPQGPESSSWHDQLLLGWNCH